jgi:serine/threonine protein phosphatase 1
MILVGDVHGCYLTLKALLKKCPPDSVCLVADLIDRGPRSYEVVKYVQDSGFDCVMGNHEFMCVEAARRFSWGMDWHHNGGNATLKSYPKDGGKALDEHRKWMSKLPVHIIYDHIVDDHGRKLLVTHTGVDRPFDQFLKAGDNLFTRGPHLTPEGMFNVHGHTPLEKPIIEKTWANIDTGACYDFMGVMTALRFPQMELYIQQTLD